MLNVDIFAVNNLKTLINFNYTMSKTFINILQNAKDMKRKNQEKEKSNSMKC